MSNLAPLSVVIPVFNEEENLDELIRRCLEACRKTERLFEIFWWMMEAPMDLLKKSMPKLEIIPVKSSEFF